MIVAGTPARTIRDLAAMSVPDDELRHDQPCDETFAAILLP